MRSDALGFFWRDEPVIRVVKEKIKRVPPERTWEAPDFLPFYEEACAHVPTLFTDADLIAIAGTGVQLEYDIECYKNYVLIAFIHKETGRIVYFESHNDSWMDLAKLRWVMLNFTLIGYNNKNYDETIATLALGGINNAGLKRASDMMIVGDVPGYEVLREFRTKRLKGLDQIDLIEVAPSFCSLKTYAGRMFSKRMQDLPFHPSLGLNEQQVTVLRWYCFLDLDHTNELKVYLRQQLDLRITIGAEYGLDLRSKSDAQIAESVISNEMQARTGQRPTKTTILPGTVYYYNPPRFLQFNTPNMQWVLNTIIQTPFIVSESGKVGLPENLKELLIPIGGSKYQMGIGGLHSTEHGTAYVASEDILLLDRDVASYYPEIMRILGLFPPHLGPAFLQAFSGIVDRRLAAKRNKDKVTADALKITINGTYGKLGSVFSFLYAPHQIIQVTITGQLALLMLIERIELAGLSVISANTDGIVTRCPKKDHDKFEAIIAQWEADTHFQTEETRYSALYSKDVNNYIALKEGGGYKSKGVYANPWDKNNPDTFSLNEQLKHNPTNLICIEAVLAQLMQGVPVVRTLRDCNDVRKFISVRQTKHGAVKDGVYLGKAIRWYYAEGVTGEIISAKTGHKISRSDGAKPLMLLPDTLPDDINYDWYERECNKILKSIGYSDA
jgi:hypothetical protein